MNGIVSISSMNINIMASIWKKFPRNFREKLFLNFQKFCDVHYWKILGMSLAEIKGFASMSIK